MASQEYFQHKETCLKLMEEGEQINQNSLAEQSDTVQMRIDKNNNITQALQESHQKL